MSSSRTAMMSVVIGVPAFLDPVQDHLPASSKRGSAGTTSSLTPTLRHPIGPWFQVRGFSLRVVAIYRIVPLTSSAQFFKHLSRVLKLLGHSTNHAAVESKGL